MPFFYTFLALFGLSYGLFGPFLTLFNPKTSFLVLLGKEIPEKLSGVSVKGGEGVPTISAKISLTRVPKISTCNRIPLVQAEFNPTRIEKLTTLSGILSGPGRGRGQELLWQILTGLSIQHCVRADIDFESN